MINKTISLMAVFSYFLIMSGCASVTGFPARTDNVEEQLEHLEKHYFHPDANSDKGKIHSYNKSKESDERKKLRNEITHQSDAGL